MAKVYQGNTKTYTAGENLTSAKWLFVTLETDTFIDLADATTDVPVGVLQDAPNTGQEGLVVKGGETKVVAAEALAVNEIVATDAAGKAQVAVNGQTPCGRVVVAAGAADDVAVIEFFWSGDELGGADTFTTITFAAGGGIIGDTTTGFTVPAAANQKMGFWGLTPVVQPTHNADPASTAAQTQDTLTDSTGGAANTTLVDCLTEGGGATLTAGDGAKIKDNFADIAAQLAKIKTDVATCVADCIANNAAIDAINADMATTGLTAAS